jgi:hypothetical protein
MARFAVISGSAPLVEAAGRALSPKVTVFAASPWFPTGDNRPFLLQFQFFGYTGSQRRANKSDLKLSWRHRFRSARRIAVSGRRPTELRLQAGDEQLALKALLQSEVLAVVS